MVFPTPGVGSPAMLDPVRAKIAIVAHAIAGPVRLQRVGQSGTVVARTEAVTDISQGVAIAI